MIITRHLAATAVIALTAALLITLCPVTAQAQQAISAGDAQIQRTKGLNDPDFVGKWDFNQPEGFGAWKPMQSASLFELRNGVILVTAKSQRPCLDLKGPYAADEIGSIEIRLRARLVERETPDGSAGAAMQGANKRVRVLPAVYQGTRIYFTRSAKEKFDAANSIEFEVQYDDQYHVLTIYPHDHPAWDGLIQKIRLDIGDFPNHYELDSIYFHRKASTKKKSQVEGKDKTITRVGAVSVESNR